jgi:hypothetical protein
MKYYCRVAGVTFAPDYPGNLLRLAIQSPRVPREASLIREPDNEHDSNAVVVFMGGRPIGHLPRTVAASLAPRLDAGERFRATDVAILIDDDHPNRPGVHLVLESV